MTTATATLNYSKKHISSINWKLVCIFGFAVLAMALFFYAYQISNLTRGYYLINSYKRELTNLSAENNNLQVSFAESSFLAGVLQKAQDHNFEKTTSVKYLQIKDNSFAIAK